MKLSRKDDVEIFRRGELVASGRVDMLALDGSVFWVVQNDGQGRAMFLHSDGFTVPACPAPAPSTDRQPPPTSAVPPARKSAPPGPG